MKAAVLASIPALLCAGCSLHSSGPGGGNASANDVPQRIVVRPLKGWVNYSRTNGETRAFVRAAEVGVGTFSTGPTSEADLVFPDSGSVVRMAPSTVVKLENASKERWKTSAFTETELWIENGNLTCATKLTGLISKFEVFYATGALAHDRGTLAVFQIHADGTCAVLDGAVILHPMDPGPGHGHPIVLMRARKACDSRATRVTDISEANASHLSAAKKSFAAYRHERFAARPGKRPVE